jgi:hypothetical protein
MSRNALLSLNFIKTVYVLALWMIAGWSFIATAQAAQVTLAWTASSSANVGGYHLVYGEASRSYTQEIDVGKQTLYTVTNLEQGRTYYFAVHAYWADALILTGQDASSPRVFSGCCTSG